MDEPARSVLGSWSDFYVIVGSSAAALTGLQFVVIALVNDLREAASEQTISAFSSPTVVHFAIALLISAIMTTPWPAVWLASVAVTICGVACFVYGLIVMHRARRQTQYRPVIEDWIWHVSLPLVAYAILTVSAVVLNAQHAAAPFGIGAAVLLLVFVGIHNAWDTVTYVALRSAARSAPAKDETPAQPAEKP